VLPEQPYIGDVEAAARAHSRELDTPELRLGRLLRLRAEMARQDVAAVVLFDPVNVRYATGARNMQVFMARNPARYAFVPLEGPVVLFEFTGARHLADGLETVDEVRPATTVSAVAADTHLDARAAAWAAEIADLVRRHCGERVRVGVERIFPGAAQDLAAKGFEIVDAQLPVERARAIKSEAELACIRASVRATEIGVRRLEQAIRPGASENEVWAELHAANVAQDGDYIETRLFASGPRTNPWFQESSPRLLRDGELVALDTDVVGPYGYYSDFSRTFLCGDGKPTAEQRTLYRLAYEQIHHDMELLVPGRSFREVAERAWRIPDRFAANRYFVLAHGCGMTGEYPYILHLRDLEAVGYDGIVQPNMTLCVESYIGAEGGAEGVKLEEQVLITETGIERLSRYPFDDRLLGTEG
jgi:Xaa-Pro aminopeptidase